MKHKISRTNIVGLIFVVLLLPLGYWLNKSSYFSSSADTVPYNTRVYGKVINDSGDPVNGVKVAVSVGGNEIPKAATNEWGEFSFMVQAPLVCDIIFTHPAYFPLWKTVTIQRGVVYNLGTIVIQPLRPNTGVYGVVETQLGNFLPDAYIQLEQTGSGYVQSVMTDDHGFFTTDQSARSDYSHRFTSP